VPEVYGTPSSTLTRASAISRVVTTVVVWMLAVSIALAGFVAIANH
jgi:hypothetical protein